MTRAAWVAGVLVLAANGGAGGAPRRHDARGEVVLNGVRTAVHWTDGDSFKVQAGPFTGKGTRLVGYNALEAFGPVHSWGEWTPEELFALASDSARVAASEAWVCATEGQEDGYHRLLVRCPELALAMAAQGHGMAYSVEGDTPDPAVLAAQREAMAARRGMWRKGVVAGVVTSVHSLGEAGEEGAGRAYNRVADTRTGLAHRRAHQRTYATCERVCEETEGQRSCMVYVPFERRYRHRPGCLLAPARAVDGASGPESVLEPSP
jgi:endonuclease YncB( thermonuclease family)